MNWFQFSYTLLFLLLFSTELQSKELSVAFGQHRPPYIFIVNDNKLGIEIDIVRAALAYKGHTIKTIKSIPNYRLDIGLEENYADVIVGVLFKSDNTFFSEPYLTFENYAITKTNKNISIKSIKDLFNYSISTFQGAHAYLGDEYKESYNSHGGNKNTLYREYPNQKDQVNDLVNNKYQIAIMDKHVFNWYLKKLKKKKKIIEDFTFHDLFKNDALYRVNFKNKKLRDDFNEGLKDLKSHGKLKSIYNAYK